MMIQVWRWVAAACLLAVAALPAHARTAPWIESWGTALPLLPPPPPPPQRPASADAPPSAPSPRVPFPPSFDNQTVRMIVRTSAGGPRFRLEFANVMGGESVTFGAVHAALAGAAGSIEDGTDRAVTFGGKSELTLFPGARAVSDPIDLALPPLTEVSVSIYLPGPTPANTVDEIGLMPTYIAPGNAAASAKLAQPTLAASYFWLKGLSVPAAEAAAGTIVALGDSITEGYSTTAGAHRSWPELLAERMQGNGSLSTWGVVNAGISGNRILRTGAGDAAVARFADDVLARPGVKWVILFEGINDINMSIIPGMPAGNKATAEDLVAGLSQLIDRAHLHGVKVAVGTIMPTRGLPFWSAEGESMRAAVNHWIRTGARADAVIDFDAATRDPVDQLRIRPDIDPGDHVHPNDAGNVLMANAIDLAIFE